MTIATTSIAEQIKAQARDLGFDLVAIASAQPSRHRSYFQQWLASGQAGDMRYLTKRFEERTDVRAYLPGARSVICVAVNYYVPLEQQGTPGHGRIARYALGD